MKTRKAHQLVWDLINTKSYHEAAALVTKHSRYHGARSFSVVQRLMIKNGLWECSLTKGHK